MKVPSCGMVSCVTNKSRQQEGSAMVPHHGVIRRVAPTATAKVFKSWSRRWGWAESSFAQPRVRARSRSAY